MKTVFRTQILRTSLVEIWTTDLLGAASVATLIIMPLVLKNVCNELSCPTCARLVEGEESSRVLLTSLGGHEVVLPPVLSAGQVLVTQRAVVHVGLGGCADQTGTFLTSVQGCSTSTETILRTVRDRGAQDGHLNFHTTPTFKKTTTLFIHF